MAEGDEAKLKRAAHNMVRRLASGLALVTAKEVLRQTLVSTFRQELSDPQWDQVCLSWSTLGDLILYDLQGYFSEHHVQLLVEGNLELACLVVENVAVRRGIQDVDRILEAEYEARRIHRQVSFCEVKSAFPNASPQRRPSQPFWNPKNPLSDIAASLPAPLRIQPSGVTEEQMRVYEQLSRCKLHCDDTITYSYWLCSARIEEQKHASHPSKVTYPAVAWSRSRSIWTAGDRIAS
jgi:CCR4-NOT transcription complex subunit 1